MRYSILFFLWLFITNFSFAQSEKKITILPFQPKKEQVKRPSSARKKQNSRKVAPKQKKSSSLSKEQLEKKDTVNDYLKRESTLMKMAPATSSSSLATTVPGFISKERSRYQKGQTPSTIKVIPFGHRTYDKYDQDARTLPVDPGSYSPSNGAGLSFDMNEALSMAFSKKARMRERNRKNRLWEKYPKVIPDDSLVNELNVKPDKMLSVRQLADSVKVKAIMVDKQASTHKDSVAIKKK